MAIIFQRNKATGATYAYENRAYWDKEKQQSRARRTLVGKVDPASGEIVKTRGYKKKGPAPIAKYRRSFFGATYLFDQIGAATGVEADLKACFPDSYKKILSIAYFLILEGNSSLSRFPHWQRLHAHPYGDDIPSQRSSELFQSIEEEGRMLFFQRQGRRRLDKEYWAFDTTTVSSYSDVLKQVKRGRNKERGLLPQLNLALLFGEKSKLPFYYRKLPGNITDVSTIKRLMREFDVMGYRKVNVILDRGFYSKGNIDLLYKSRQKFALGVKLSLGYVKGMLDEERENLKSWPNLQSQFGVYGLCRAFDWEYEEKRPYRQDVRKGKRRAYLHLYYSPEKAAKDEAEANDHLTRLYNDLRDGGLKACRAKDYEKYFHVAETPKRGRRIRPKEEAMREAARNHGYFALLTNEVRDPHEALALYKSKEIVEKAFGDLKERLNFRRMQVSSELSLDGKIFVGFIALIYLSYVKKQMLEAKLFDKWTMQGLLDDLDTIELFEAPGHGRALGEVTEKQANLYKAMGVPPPSL